LCSRTVHVLLRQGEGQKGRKRLGQQPSHVTSGSARYSHRMGRGTGWATPTTSGDHKDEAAQPHTVVIITKKVGSLVNR
jgi:hypothetical protein